MRILTHIDGDEMDLCVTVLPRLRGGHVDDFARAPFDDNMTVVCPICFE